MTKYVIAEYLTKDEAIAYLEARLSLKGMGEGERAILYGIIRLLREGEDAP